MTVCNTLFWKGSLPDSGFSFTYRTVSHHKNTEERKKNSRVLEIQAYKIQGHWSPISFSLITDLHLYIFPGTTLQRNWLSLHTGLSYGSQQPPMNGLFQQDASCVWFNSMYIYVTEPNQVGLCAITIMFAQLHLGRKALPLEYWQDASGKKVYIIKSWFKGFIHLSVEQWWHSSFTSTVHSFSCE